jgi:hypothetical protein
LLNCFTVYQFTFGFCRSIDLFIESTFNIFGAGGEKFIGLLADKCPE